ncbi:MAG: hypothetical protein ACREJO_09370 [Phycisphaerales bacterium]
MVQHPDPITPVSTADDTYVSYLYNTPVDDALSRPGALAITDGTLEGMPLVQYQRVGLGTVAVTDLSQMGIQLDRTVEADGHRSAAGYSDNPGRYGGWDKFGRLTLNSWANVGFHNNNKPMLWQERYGYLRDPSTGWWLARNRWYDAEAGRWINRDPAGYMDDIEVLRKAGLAS